METSKNKVGRPKTQSANKIIVPFSADPETIAQLKHIAQEDERSLSFIIRKAIKQYLCNQQKSPIITE